MYRVIDVLKPEVGRSWLEVVAIVQEVASQLMPGSAVPGSDDLLLDDDGTLRLGFGPDTQEHPVSGLGTLLQTLLTGIDAPPGLRELAETNATSTPSHSTLESFQRGLGFYERPGRANELRAVAARLAAHASQPRRKRNSSVYARRSGKRAEGPKAARKGCGSSLQQEDDVHRGGGGAGRARRDRRVRAAAVYFRRPVLSANESSRAWRTRFRPASDKLPVGDAALPAPVQAEAPPAGATGRGHDILQGSGARQAGGNVRSECRADANANPAPGRHAGSDFARRGCEARASTSFSARAGPRCTIDSRPRFVGPGCLRHVFEF